jgi:hypothetical protein
MKVEIKNGRLIISLKLRKPTPSKSGKTLLVASTRGVKSSNEKVSGRRVRVNANAFIDIHRLKQPT